MSIGLFDADIESYGLNPFNLELMKCATYYKKKREIVGFSPTFSPERYTSFIYRKDCQDGRFDKRLMQNDNIEYGGLAFSNGLYVPLDKKIELCKPDVHIYDSYISGLLITKTDATDFKTL